MRILPLLCLTACARTVPAGSTATTDERSHRPPELATRPPHDAGREPIVAPARGARELVEDARVATFLTDRELTAGTLDANAMEHWFARPPRRVFVYAERPLEVAEIESPRRVRCQPVERWNSGVLDELAVVIWAKGRHRTILVLGQSRVTSQDQTRERDAWNTLAVRPLPMQAVAWDRAHVRYVEGAESYEVACVPALRTVSCGAGHPPEARGSCVDHELVVRPWRAPTVPHVGPVIPAYDDAIPDVPAGDCDVRCERSACQEALRLAALPRTPLYDKDAPVLAAFRSLAACRAFAAARDRARAPSSR